MIPTMTLSRFIHSEARKYPGSTGELSDLLSAIALGIKMISRLVATAGFKGLEGYTGRTNIQGEDTKVLDEEADGILLEILSSTGHFGLLVSEERDKVIPTDSNRLGAQYVIALDPLDGSSNLGSNIPVGTIFGIFRKRSRGNVATQEDFFQTGRDLVAAGYAVYGAKTSFVYSCGNGVHGFTLDSEIGEFVLTEDRIKIPERGKTYSVNEGNAGRWHPKLREFVETLKIDNKELGTPYSARYVGSLVADFDRNLHRGGIFLYPADSKSSRGKLRLLYECMPLAYIVEQAGGRAVDGERRAILDVKPQDIHERCPFIVGSRFEVDWFERVTG